MLARLLRPVARPLLRQSPIASRFAVQQFGFHASTRTLDAAKAPAQPAQHAAPLFSDVSALAASASGHKSSSHWSKERLLSISLVPSMFLGIFFDNVVIDLAIVAALVPHCHMGMEQVLMDYLHPRKFGFLGPLASSLLWMSSAVVLAGLIKLTFDGGVTKTLKQVLHA